MITSFSRGNKIFFDVFDNVWKYLDDNSIFDDSKPCAKCRKHPTEEGYDACLGYVPGIKNACCGHGVNPVYFQRNERKTINGK